MWIQNVEMNSISFIVFKISKKLIFKIVLVFKKLRSNRLLKIKFFYSTMIMQRFPMSYYLLYFWCWVFPLNRLIFNEEFSKNFFNDFDLIKNIFILLIIKKWIVKIQKLTLKIEKQIIQIEKKKIDMILKLWKIQENFFFNLRETIFQIPEFVFSHRLVTYMIIWFNWPEKLLHYKELKSKLILTSIPFSFSNFLYQAHLSLDISCRRWKIFKLYQMLYFSMTHFYENSFETVVKYCGTMNLDVTFGRIFKFCSGFFK